MVSSAGFSALGTGVRVLSTEPGALPAAVAAVRGELAAIDAACSRFRDDSELTRLNRRAGEPVQVSPLLFAALEAAVRACRMTGGAVDPTMGRAIRVLGYDRDFAQLDRVSLPLHGAGQGVVNSPSPSRGEGRGGGAAAQPVTLIVQPAGGIGVIEMDRRTRVVRVQGGHELDLGATAKALAADRAALAAQTAAGCGVLVSIGGDLRVAGESPPDGWPVLITDDHAAPLDGPGDVISLRSGALATSSTAVRRWRQNGTPRHHILDPSTGVPAQEHWRTVSVVAGSCVDANTAATAAIVWGERAIGWLAQHRLPARLVRADGSVTYLAGWPVGSSVAA